MKPPCNNCITFPICRSQLENYRYPLNRLLHKCSILRYYILKDELIIDNGEEYFYMNIRRYNKVVAFFGFPEKGLRRKSIYGFKKVRK